MSPRYEYKCPRCQITIEQRRSFEDDSPAPMCGDCLVSMEKVYGSIPVHFKGQGFYAKDKGRK